MEKIKNLPFMRFVAFAVALALILGICSVFLRVTASADDVTSDNIPSSISGTFGNYNAVKFSATSQIFDPSTVFSDYMNKSYFGIFVYEKNGQLVVLDNLYSYRKNNNIFFKLGQLNFGTNFCDMYFFIHKTDLYKNSSNSLARVYDNYVMFWHRKDGFNYDLDKNLDRNSLPNFAFSFSDGITDVYMIYSSVSSILTDSECKSKISDMTADVNKMSISQWQGSDSSTAPKAEFVTCASFKREDGSLPLWFKDFTADGLQYPMFSYYISDNGNKHRYQVRLSYSSSQADVVNTIFGIVNENNLSDQEKTLRDLGAFLKGNLPISSSNYDKFRALKPYMELILKKPEYISFDEAFTLNSNQMNFEASEVSGNKIYTICLSDYSDIIANYIYRAQIIDMQTSQILDTTYFCSNKTYHKGDSGTGAKIYDYGDNYTGMIEDIKNNTPSVTPGIDNKFSTSGDIINMKDNDYLSGLKIDNIFSVLGQSAKSIGAFFQACFNIVPSAILSILLSTMSLLIVLRVLGR